jgi:ssDNA-binding Zn-finger/Zn-ribbon topoisomerase 1
MRAQRRRHRFSELIGKLDVLRIECPKCGRAGQYRLADLIMRYGRNEKLFAFTADVTANCTRKQARSDNDPCGALCPDLPKVL